MLLGVGCGSDSENAGENGAAPATDVTVRAEEFTFTPDEVVIPAGETVTITLQNDGEVEHDLQVDGLTIEPMGDTDMAGDHAGAGEGMLALHTTPGETAEMRFTTEQTGTFEFYCTISGHKEAGMVGALTVS